MSVHIRWRMEERKLPNGGLRTIRVAWIVEHGGYSNTENIRFLAYMGPNPLITNQLKFEFDALYPEIKVDWEVLEGEIGQPQTDAATLTFDELACRIRPVLGEYGLILDRVDDRLGRGWTRPLRDVERLLRDPGVTARFERTAGSIFSYFRQKHPEYAYALYKVRLLLVVGEDALNALENREPEMQVGSRFRKFRQFCLDILAQELDDG